MNRIFNILTSKLLLPVFLGHKEIVELLIQRGANSHTVTDNNTAALKLAEEHGSEKMEKKNYQSNLFTILLCRLGHKDIMDLLVQNLANHTAITARPTLPSGNRVSEEEEGI